MKRRHKHPNHQEKAMSVTAQPFPGPIITTTSGALQLLRPAGGHVTHNTEIVTPAIAQEWLATTNTHNRPINVKRYLGYADDMREGRWDFNGEPIQFDVNGVLLNGQHRCQAVVESGTTQRFLVVRGLPPSAQITMDMGVRRLPSDQLRMVDIHVSTSVAAAIRVRLRWDQGLLFGDAISNRISTAAVVRWAQDNAEAVAVMQDLNHHQVLRHFPRPAITIAVASRLIQISAEDAAQFLDAAASGANLPAGSPMLALRNRFHRHKENGGQVTEKDQIGYFVMAWNAYRQGRTLAKVQKSAWTSATFPVPE